MFLGRAGRLEIVSNIWEIENADEKQKKEKEGIEKESDPSVSPGTKESTALVQPQVSRSKRKKRQESPVNAQASVKTAIPPVTPNLNLLRRRR